MGFSGRLLKHSWFEGDNLGRDDLYVTHQNHRTRFGTTYGIQPLYLPLYVEIVTGRKEKQRSEKSLAATADPPPRTPVPIRPPVSLTTILLAVLVIVIGTTTNNPQTTYRS